MDRQKKATNLVKNSKNHKKMGKTRKIIALLCVILIFSAFCCFFNLINPRIVSWLKNDFSIVTSNKNLLVHFVSVGQGDAIAINFPDGKTMLIDAGPSSATNHLINYLDEKVLNTKRHKNVDYLVLTHADADHIGGALRLVKNYNIKTIFMPKLMSDTLTYNRLNEYVAENNLNAKQISAEFDIDKDYKLQIFGPLNFTDQNNSCPLIKVEFKGKSFLFTGDLESTAEIEFATTVADELDCDVLKVAHHGSRYSTSDEFLEAVTPEYAVISSGNQYGHPHDETLTRLNNANAKIVRTDSEGDIVFVVGRDYDLDLLTGNYTITGFIFDYRLIVLIIDGLMIVNIVLILIKKEKHKN